MPYTYKKKGDKYVVYKKDSGKKVGETDGTKEALNKYLAALHMHAEGNTFRFKTFQDFINESALVDHAERELKLAGMIGDSNESDDIDAKYNNLVAKAVLELMKKFSEQGHSGFSASMVREIFNKLTNWETLTPITSNPDEWMNCSELTGPEDSGMWQNRRNPAVFSKDGGKTWYNVNDKNLKKVEESILQLLPTKYFKTFEEYMVGLNPGQNVMGMGPVKFPGNPGTNSTFHGQYIGSGDTPMFVFDTKPKDDEEEEKKRIKKALKAKQEEKSDKPKKDKK